MSGASESGTILIIGGTTEGRIAVKVCDEAGKPFYYSTKNSSQEVESAHGERITGGLDEVEMPLFCQSHKVLLIIDAAHPFAQNVHANVGKTAQQLGIAVIRLERHFPQPPENLHWFDDYQGAMNYLKEQKISRLLALSGVNTIAKLRDYWKDNKTYFRIMKREESLEVVKRNGFPLEQLIYYDDEEEDRALFTRLQPQAILTKESGETGGFVQKVEVALALGIPVLVIRRPALPYTPTATVYGKHGLRREIELLLPDYYPLKTGFTTGSCATAATKAALMALLTGKSVDRVDILLPNEEPYRIEIEKVDFPENGSVTATVVKYSGDDPDVTHQTEICSNVRLNEEHREVRFLQGVGVGKVTLPGLGLEIGGPAINATPRKMMKAAVEQVLDVYGEHEGYGVDVTISVPKGEELAQRTFNPKLGIVGGISIIGTSGIIRPFSSEAFVNSIRREVQVAKALDVERLVLNSGAKSEKYLKDLYPNLPTQAFVQYGNFIGETLKVADEEGFTRVILGIMLGKAVKLAEGILDTHSKKSVMNKDFILSIAREAGCPHQVLADIEEITLARELWSVIPEKHADFFQLIKKRCYETTAPLLSGGELTLYLITDEGVLM